MQLLLVEDDPMQLPRIEERLAPYFPDMKVRRASTEREFRQMMPELLAEPPDIVVCDVRLRWTKPPHIDTPPPECRDHTEAGLRCCRALHASPGTSNVPVVLYTVHTGEDFGNALSALGPKVRLVTKSGDISELAKAVENFLQTQAPERPDHPEHDPAVSSSLR